MGRILVDHRHGRIPEVARRFIRSVWRSLLTSPEPPDRSKRAAGDARTRASAHFCWRGRWAEVRLAEVMLSAPKRFERQLDVARHVRDHCVGGSGCRLGQRLMQGSETAPGVAGAQVRESTEGSPTFRLALAHGLRPCRTKRITDGPIGVRDRAVRSALGSRHLPGSAASVELERKEFLPGLDRGGPSGASVLMNGTMASRAREGRVPGRGVAGRRVGHRRSPVGSGCETNL